jgi:hypothetical protein
LSHLALAVAFAALSAFAQTDEKVVGTIQQVLGPDTVTIKHPDRAIDRKARITELIYKGEQIITVAEQTVYVELMDQTEVVVAPESSLTIAALGRDPKKPTLLDQAYGLMRTLVRKERTAPEGQLVVRTPTAAMGVRGTQFFSAVGRRSFETRLNVLQGKVAFAPTMAALQDPPKTVLVAAGQMSTLKSGDAKASAPQSFDVKSFLPGFGKSTTPLKSEAFPNGLNGH